MRGPFGTPWPVDDARGRRRRRSPPAASASPPLRPAILRDARPPRALRAARAPLRRALARPAALSPTSSRTGRQRGLEVAGDGRQRRSRVARPRRRRDAADPRARSSTGRARSRCSCGPEVMMRFVVAALLERRRRAERHLRLDGAQHAVRHRPLRALPARPDARLPRRAGLPLVASSSRGWRSGSCDERAAQANARGLEVLLLRRLPAQPARLRGRAARRSPSASRSPTSSRPRARRSRAPTTSRWSRARSPRRTTPSGSARCGASSRALITIGACATAGGIQALRNFADVEEFTRDRLRLARLHLDARDLDADQRPRRRSTSSCTGCPINKQPAARGDQRAPATAAGRASARTASASSASGAATCA